MDFEEEGRQKLTLMVSPGKVGYQPALANDVFGKATPIVKKSHVNDAILRLDTKECMKDLVSIFNSKFSR